jgi:hypothetical protein
MYDSDKSRLLFATNGTVHFRENFKRGEKPQHYLSEHRSSIWRAAGQGETLRALRQPTEEYEQNN